MSDQITFLVPEEWNAAKRKIAAIIFGASATVVPIEDITLEIKPYQDRGSYLQVTVDDRHRFSKDHRESIAASFTMAGITTTSYHNENTDMPLKLDMNGRTQQSDAILHALATHAFEIKEWSGAGYKTKRTDKGRS